MVRLQAAVQGGSVRYKLLFLASLTVVAVAALAGQKQNAQTTTFDLATSVKFAVSTDKTFDRLMDEAMNMMDTGMQNATPTGDPDRDFVTMMIPHHQGAIDMAKAVLLYGKDPQIRRLAQEIITDQDSEIQLMQLWLERRPESTQNTTRRPGPKHEH